MWFTKDKLHKTKEVVLHMTFMCGTLEFVKSFTHCEMDERHLVLGDKLFEIYMVDMRC